MVLLHQPDTVLHFHTRRYHLLPLQMSAVGHAQPAVTMATGPPRPKRRPRSCDNNYCTKQKEKKDSIILYTHTLYHTVEVF